MSVSPEVHSLIYMETQIFKIRVSIEGEGYYRGTQSTAAV